MVKNRQGDDSGINGEEMRFVHGNEFVARVNSCCLISLLMKGFLWSEALIPESRLKNWLCAVDKVNVKDSRKKIDLAAAVVLKLATKNFCATLERGLSESERHFLAANVREFVEIYGKNRSNHLGLQVLTSQAWPGCGTRSKPGP